MNAKSQTPEQELDDIRTEASAKLWMGVTPDGENSFIQLPLSLKEKYKKIDFIRLIKENAKSQDWGQRLLRALDRIYQCGVDVLKPKEDRPQTWRTFEYKDPKYATDIRTMKGTKEILFQIGFTRERQYDFFYCEMKPDARNDIIEVSAELYFAKAELECYLRGEHSREDDFSRLVGQEFRPGAGDKTKLQHDGLHMRLHENTELLQDQLCSDDTTEMLPDTEIRCQHCQFINLPDAELCISCAEPLKSEMNSPVVLKKETLQPTTQEMPTEKTCQFCTYINPPEVTVCIMCSKTFTNGAEAEDKEFNIQGACGGYIQAEVELEAAYQNGYEDQEETYNVIQCAACTYFNPLTTNICQMCYTSLIGNVIDTVPEIAGDTQDPNNNTNTEGAVGKKGEATNFDLTSSKKKPGQIPRKVSKANKSKTPRNVSKKTVGTNERAENHEQISPKKKPGQNSGNRPKVSIPLKNNDTGDYFPKEKSRCQKCGAKCLPKLGPFEDRGCSSCDFRFCDGCSKPFEKNCRRNRHCPTGPHCHHPRDCVFYLRNFKQKTLKKLLSSQKLDFIEYADWVKIEAKRRECSEKVIETETSSESKNWLCKPYTEYLISIINKHNVDPAVIMNPEQLKSIIRRELDFEAPGTKGRALLEFVQKNCPMR